MGAHRAVGIDEPSQQRQPLIGRQTEHPVRDPLGQRPPTETIHLQEIGERGSAPSGQPLPIGRQDEIEIEFLLGDPDDLVDQTGVGGIDGDLHRHVSVAVLEEAVTEEETEEPAQIGCW